jgi:malate synthase
VAYIEKHGLQVAVELSDFVDGKALPGTGVNGDLFWKGFSELVHELGPKNKALLDHRLTLKGKIDTWHLERRGRLHDRNEYQAFLKEIGYLAVEGGEFKIETSNVDPEIAKIPGPQLVVPIMNARYALNAANARWGSLYDAMYGTDVLGDLPEVSGYDRGRGGRVVARARVMLDDHFAIDGTSHADVRTYEVVDGQLLMDGYRLRDPDKFKGYRGSRTNPEAILLENNSLHMELLFDGNNVIGRRDQAALADVLIESAVTAIMDCEDSVVAVDAEDKVLCYANWLGLMNGNLEEKVTKGGKTFTRKLNPDRKYIAPDGSTFSLKGRALMWVRNVGHLMTNPSVRDKDGNNIFEGLMDGLITTLIAMHDLKRESGNSVEGSIYVVKPKMHGPEEVAFACEVFNKVEEILGLPRYTVKIGIMDEERRTTVNLKECIRVAMKRVAFINTGFLDRTGDEIHTSMEAGPFSRKDFIKRKGWIGAYETQNVDIGLECGLPGKAQIGKGMWAAPDMMAEMMEEKINHPRSGANCAWVPSPTAATLHALHYHKVDVFAVQAKIKANGRRGHVENILDIPTATYQAWTQDQIVREIENNAQGILGYVVRWVDQGVGCSKVPDINNVGLMEDRATCRISSQHIANWLHHNIVDRDQVMEIMRRMALVVDRQNVDDASYRPMGPDFQGMAFLAACDLVFLGTAQPAGYTEPILHSRRLELKALK